MANGHTDVGISRQRFKAAIIFKNSNEKKYAMNEEWNERRELFFNMSKGEHQETKLDIKDKIHKKP